MPLYLTYRRARALAARAAHETLGRGAALATRVLTSRRRHAPVLPANPGRILVLSLQKIGDAVVVEPAIRLLGARFPSARIEAAAAASRELGPDMGACEVLALAPAVARVHAIRRRRDLAALAGESDLVVAFGLRARDAWAARRARGRRGVALGYSWEGRGAALDIALAPPEQVMLPAPVALARGARPQHAFWGELLVRAGIATPDDVARAGAPRLVVPESARSDARELLSERGLEGPLVVLAPWNAQPHFRWPEDRWVALGRALLERGVARSIAIVGGSDKAERAHAARLAEALGPRASSIAGTFGLARDAAILERTALVVAVDSGPAHVARAVGAPTVVLFGPGSPPVWAPPGARVLQRTSGCHGCRQPRCHQERRECLEDLGADEVLAACIETAGKAARSA